MAKQRFSSRLRSDEITTHMYRVLTFTKCTDSQACGYKRSRIFPRIEGMGMILVWLWFWLSCVKLCDLYNSLCGSHFVVMKLKGSFSLQL
jgi:hypothetical protein